jgi:hypothetical protein
MKTKYLKVQLIPRNKHPVSVINTNPLILNRETIAVCSEVHVTEAHTVDRISIYLMLNFGVNEVNNGT